MIESAGWFSRIGTRAANQDSCAYWWVGDTFFAAVADGLGGMPGGGEASRQVVGFLRRCASGSEVTAGRLAALVLEAHADLRRLQQRQPQYASMATTLTALAVRGDALVAAHCGDTRLFRARRGDVEQLTEDHSEAQRLFNHGLLTADEFAHYPRKNILLSALGVPDDPTVQSLASPVEPGDWLVIASDGAYNQLEPADLRETARAARDPARFASVCRRLIETRDPRDNYTLVVARVAAERRIRRVLRRAFRHRDGGNVAAPA